MKNLHIILTNKPSPLVLETINNNLFLTTTTDFGTDMMKFQNIYITNSEDVKNGDCYLNGRHIYKADSFYEKAEFDEKIIITTDTKLIEGGVQSIDDTFLEWFVKNSSCEEVKIKSYKLHFGSTLYKIIIPKEEPKQDATLTAKDFLKKYLAENPECKFDEVMVEFARLHVKRALKDASDNVELTLIKYTDDYEVNKDSILNSYPLDNIK